MILSDNKEKLMMNRTRRRRILLLLPRSSLSSVVLLHFFLCLLAQLASCNDTSNFGDDDRGRVATFRSGSKTYPVSQTIPSSQTPTANRCKWNLDKTTQTLRTPGYPNNYYSLSDCSMTISAPYANNKFVFKFESFYVEPDPSCTKDRVEIFDLMSDNRFSSTPSKTYCGRLQTPFVYVSKGPSIRIRLWTDDSGEYPGFYASYTFTDDQGTTMAPSSVSKPVMYAPAPQPFTQRPPPPPPPQRPVYRPTPAPEPIPHEPVQQPPQRPFYRPAPTPAPEPIPHEPVEQPPPPPPPPRPTRARPPATTRPPPPPRRSRWTFNLVPENDTVSSPAFYLISCVRQGEDTDCTISISAPSKTDRIVFTFESLNMESSTGTYCPLNNIEIYDDASNPSLPVRAYCSQTKPRFKYTSRGPVVRVKLIAVDEAQYSGFSGRYAFIRGETRVPIAKDPTGTFDEIPENATVMSGSSHLLSCVPADKASNDTVRWTKDGSPVGGETFQSGTKLLIKEFTAIDSGRYACHWKHHTREAYVMAQPAPCSMVFLKRPQNLVLSEGEKAATLECHSLVSSMSRSSDGEEYGIKPTTKVTWLKDGYHLEDNSTKYETLRSGSLIIYQLTPSDAGFYTCRSSHIDEPTCVLESIAHINVNPRVNIDEVCGRPVTGRPAVHVPDPNEHKERVFKIVGGSDAQKGAFPWQVMFWDYKRHSFCGGALLNERWILTAAHCFVNKDPNETPPPPEVRLGRYDQTDLNEPTQFVTKIADVIKHPDFSRETYDNDIALVRVTDHIPFTKYIRPICLPRNPSRIADAFFNSKTLKLGHVTGWGQLKEGGPQPKFLQELRVPIQAQDTCVASTQYSVSENMFCAGYAQEIVGDACKGDSGGPFVVEFEGCWHLLGIVSWGEGCGRAGRYGFYTRVSNYIDWIRPFIRL